MHDKNSRRYSGDKIMRRCTICGEEKPDNLFIHDRTCRGGIKNVCRECNKKRAKRRRYYLKNKIEKLENKLEIAERYLGLYADIDNWLSSRANRSWAKLAFAEMERVEENNDGN